MDLTQSFPSWHLNEPFDFLPHGISDPNYVQAGRSNLYVTHDNDLNHPYVSPCFASETSVPLPRTLIHCGGAERVRDDSIYFSRQAFTESPIQLEIFEEMVHVFQLFSGFSPFAKLSLDRMGKFIREQTGTEPHQTFERNSIFIRNKSGFPIEPAEDALQVLSDGAALLVDQGTWAMEDQEGKVVLKPVHH